MEEEQETKRSIQIGGTTYELVLDDVPEVDHEVDVVNEIDVDIVNVGPHEEELEEDIHDHVAHVVQQPTTSRDHHMARRLSPTRSKKKAHFRPRFDLAGRPAPKIPPNFGKVYAKDMVTMGVKPKQMPKVCLVKPPAREEEPPLSAHDLEPLKSYSDDKKRVLIPIVNLLNQDILDEYASQGLTEKCEPLTDVYEIAAAARQCGLETVKHTSGGEYALPVSLEAHAQALTETVPSVDSDILRERLFGKYRTILFENSDGTLTAVPLLFPISQQQQDDGMPYCALCHSVLKSWRAFEYHVNHKHLKYRPHRCIFCPKEMYYSETECINHYRTCHPNKPILVMKEYDEEKEKRASEIFSNPLMIMRDGKRLTLEKLAEIQNVASTQLAQFGKIRFRVPQIVVRNTTIADATTQTFGPIVPEHQDDYSVQMYNNMPVRAHLNYQRMSLAQQRQQQHQHQSMSQHQQHQMVQQHQHHQQHHQQHQQHHQQHQQHQHQHQHSTMAHQHQAIAQQHQSGLGQHQVLVQNQLEEEMHLEELEQELNQQHHGDVYGEDGNYMEGVQDVRQRYVEDGTGNF